MSELAKTVQCYRFYIRLPITGDILLIDKMDYTFIKGIAKLSFCYNGYVLKPITGLDARLHNRSIFLKG